MFHQWKKCHSIRFVVVTAFPEKSNVSELLLAHCCRFHSVLVAGKSQELRGVGHITSGTRIRGSEHTCAGA